MSDFLQDYGMVSYYADFFFKMFLISLKRSHKDTYTVFDVGFNTGQFTRLAIKCFNTYKSMGEIHQEAKLRIIAFEPNVFLAKVAPKFEGLEVHVLALSNTIGNETLHIPLFDGEPHDLEVGAANHRNMYGGVYGTSTLGGDRKKDLELTMPNLVWKKLDVATTTIDRFCEENEIDEIDWLKLDVEAFEKSALEGAMNSLKSGIVAYGQFEGDTSFNAVPKIATALANNEQTQLFIDECGMILLDANYQPVTLPTVNSLIENEFFFTMRKF
jgi:FkbM family methyltransferase